MTYDELKLYAKEKTKVNPDDFKDQAELLAALKGTK